MLDRKKFFETYKVQEAFDDSGLSWDTLATIYDDYEERKLDLEKAADELQEIISKEMKFNVHSIHNRCKDPEHLIEKIIRKVGVEKRQKYKKINEDNYLEIVRDLIGFRILTLSKEEWYRVHQFLLGLHKNDQYEIAMAEIPRAYIRYGDRDIFNHTIHKEYTNKGYRSQHYILKYKQYYCEIQVRTIAEEVYGEFDHFVKYPYRENNHFLHRYTSVVAELLNSVDEIISTCFQFGEEGWSDVEKYFKKDSYNNWSRIEKNAQNIFESKIPKVQDGEIDAKDYMNRMFLRKG
ncbi:RelA/SpoT domain-containing protein [Anaerostipes sp.]|uniref:RelA/SpoT domain-containing protein n=1 Tax=Anaerostipes sp. TaxID=1872530 RepID=UPI003FEEC176